MANDRLLTEVLSSKLTGKLGDLAIRTVRQLYARLRGDGPQLQRYLDLTDPVFAELRGKVEEIIRKDYPGDLQPKEFPKVGKGVAAHRL